MSEEIKRQKFDELFKFTIDKVKYKIKGKAWSMPKGEINPEVINDLYKNSLAKNASEIYITENTDRKKSYLIKTSIAFPGVVSYPMFEEVSFVRANSRFVIFQTIRVDIGAFEKSDQVEKEVQITGKTLRASIVKLSKTR